jgi:hypothetical protein
VTVRLQGSCGNSAFWREVRRRVEDGRDTVPSHALTWSVVVRRKTTSDDRVLVASGEAEDPSDYWAVYVDDEALELTVCVSHEHEFDLTSAATAEFLIELLSHASDPIADKN